jgi:hypothetical protein
MDFYTVTCEFNFDTWGSRYVESFLDLENAKRYAEEMEREFKNTVCGDREIESNDYTFSSNDKHGRVRHIHLESDTGDDTAYIDVTRKTFKDGGH